MGFGALQVFCGPMFSGKTESLAKEILYSAHCATAPVVVFRPRFDRRGGESGLITHDGVRVTARTLDRTADLDAIAEGRVFIDEVQFLEPPLIEGDALAAIAALRARGVDVVCAGLDMDYRGRAFTITASLMAEASDLRRLSARCSRCGAPATHTARAAGGDDRFRLGGGDAYAAMCQAHWWRAQRQAA